VKLPQDEHDGELPLKHVEMVLCHFGVTIKETVGGLYLQKDDVLEHMPRIDPVPRAMIAWLARTFNIDGLHFYFFGNTEPGI
jgi:hypothetical protein